MATDYVAEDFLRVHSQDPSSRSLSKTLGWMMTYFPKSWSLLSYGPPNDTDAVCWLHVIL